MTFQLAFFGLSATTCRSKRGYRSHDLIATNNIFIDSGRCSSESTYSIAAVIPVRVATQCEAYATSGHRAVIIPKAEKMNITGNSWAIAGASLVMLFLSQGAIATVMETTMNGKVVGISTSFINQGVQLGDLFTLKFSFDDTLSTSLLSPSANGTHYPIVRDYISADASGWAGSFAQFLLSQYPYIGSIGIEDSWFSQNVLHHKEWSMGPLSMITDYSGNPGGENYGWYNYGNPAGGMSIIMNSVTTAPVPEPESLAMLLSGLALMGFVSRRKATLFLSDDAP